MAMRRRRASRSPAIARSAMPNGCGGEYVEACPEDLEPSVRASGSGNSHVMHLASQGQLSNRKLMRLTRSAISDTGTKRPISEVRATIAIGDNPDVARAVQFGRE